MSKISVGETILHGYGFAVRRVLANVGLTWLAAVFYAVAASYWLQQFCTTMLVSPHPGSELNDFALFDLFCLVVVTALGSAVIARTLTGAALEPGGEIMTAYVAIAKREWILFLSLLRLYAFLIAAVFAVIFLGGVAIKMALPMIGANVAWHGIGALPVMNAALAMAVFAVIATLVVRLGFFAAPVASAECSSSMGRTWSLSQGNSWRVFVVVLGLSVPALLLWVAAEWALIGNNLAAALTTALSPSHNSTSFYQLLDANAPAITALLALLIAVMNMVFAGASVPAYATVRDNVPVYEPRSVQNVPPLLEPSFAGGFAGFTSHHAKGVVAGNAEDVSNTPAVPETLVATPDDKTQVETVTPVEAHAPVPQIVDARVAEASSVAAPVVETLSDVHTDDAAAQPPVSEAVLHTPEAPTEAQTVPGAIAPAEAATIEPLPATSEVIPLPSHADATESSQQNAPSEAA
jgi:hypothetical protein